MVDTNVFKKKINNIKASMCEGYGLKLTNKDICIQDKTIYLSTASLARLFKTSHHNFCMQYVKPLMESGVSRVCIGRCKYYSMSEVLDRVRRAKSFDCTVIQLCGLICTKRVSV